MFDINMLQKRSEDEKIIRCDLLINGSEKFNYSADIEKCKSVSLITIEIEGITYSLDVEHIIKLPDGMFSGVIGETTLKQGGRPDPHILPIELREDNEIRFSEKNIFSISAPIIKQ
jgi:hypothetical protein